MGQALSLRRPLRPPGEHSSPKSAARSGRFSAGHFAAGQPRACALFGRPKPLPPLDRIQCSHPLLHAKGGCRVTPSRRRRKPRDCPCCTSRIGRAAGPLWAADQRHAAAAALVALGQSPWRDRRRSTNLNRFRRLLALALSVHLRRYKPNFLVLHYRPGEALGDRADAGNCPPRRRPACRSSTATKRIPEWPSDGSAPGAPTYTAVQAAARRRPPGCHLLNGRPYQRANWVS